MAYLTPAELDRLAQDTGCELHNDCLTCPFDKCKYDTNMQSVKKVRRALKEANNA